MMMDGELAGFAIPRLGMGTMALAIEGRPDRDTAIRTIHAGLDAGVRYLDTAWSYYLPSEPGTGTAEDLGYGEKLVRDALTSWNGPRDEVLVATKTGYRRTMEVPAFVALVSDSGESDKQGARCPIHQNRTLRGGILRDAAVGLARNASICRRRAVNTGGWRIRAPKP
jgi:pyridoxine 4-dehydrogenase